MYIYFHTNRSIRIPNSSFLFVVYPPLSNSILFTKNKQKQTKTNKKTVSFTTPPPKIRDQTQKLNSLNKRMIEFRNTQIHGITMCYRLMLPRADTNLLTFNQIHRTPQTHFFGFSLFATTTKYLLIKIYYK